MTANDAFHRIAKRVTDWTGTPWAAALAFALVFAWLAGGVVRWGFGSDYQMWINTGTTIVTFLMVFLIQNTQNRDGRAIHLKLDELSRAVKGARNRLVDLEDLTDAEIKTLEDEFRKLHERYRPPAK